MSTFLDPVNLPVCQYVIYSELILNTLLGTFFIYICNYK